MATKKTLKKTTKKITRTKKETKKQDVVIKIKRDSNTILPNFAYEGDAGLDIFSNQEAVLKPFHRIDVSTGLYFELPLGYVGLVWDKSGLALNSGIKTMAGVIDSNYRGELKIVLVNLSRNTFRIEKGMKIAQLLIQKVETPRLEESEVLDSSSRKENGFGSSGLFEKEEKGKRKKLPEDSKTFSDIKNALG
jgi:dUTP pyrophosphatase